MIATVVLVVDASAVAELVLGTVKGRAVAAALGDHTLHAPELMPLVAGWDQSAQGHGGEGAWYVRLRRQEQK